MREQPLSPSRLVIVAVPTLMTLIQGLSRGLCFLKRLSDGQNI